MGEQQLIDLMIKAIQVVITAAAPPLLVGLMAGLAISIFQTVTSIQDQTLAFVPKILAIFISIILFGSFMMTTIMDFMRDLFSNISFYIK